MCTDSFDDEDDVVNSRPNALDVKQTPNSYTCRRNMGRERHCLPDPTATVENGATPQNLYISMTIHLAGSDVQRHLVLMISRRFIANTGDCQTIKSKNSTSIQQQ